MLVRRFEDEPEAYGLEAGDLGAEYPEVGGRRFD